MRRLDSLRHARISSREHGREGDGEEKGYEPVTRHIDLTDDDEPPSQRRRASDQPSVTRSLGIVLAAMSLIGSIFLAGYNWRSVAIIEGNQDQFVRKDVQSQQLSHLTYQIDEMRIQLDELRAELRTSHVKDR